jgi:beta-N-acetylhexosaminidase
MLVAAGCGGNERRRERSNLPMNGSSVRSALRDGRARAFGQQERRQVGGFSQGESGPRPANRAWAELMQWSLASTSWHVRGAAGITVALMTDLAGTTASTPKPLITVFFGNPYVPAGIPTLPAVMLTYDFHDLAETSAVRALVGDAPITGKLPIGIPGMFEAGWGIVR